MSEFLLEFIPIEYLDVMDWWQLYSNIIENICLYMGLICTAYNFFLSFLTQIKALAYKKFKLILKVVHWL